MIARLIWWLICRAVGNGTAMTDETHDAVIAAIREDGEAMTL